MARNDTTPGWMGNKLRAFLLGVRGSYWFYPSLLTLAALALSVLTLELDRAGLGAFLERLEHWQPVAQGAREQLNAVATSMITVAATVFAITIAAVSFASGHFGPRILSNFMHDRGNQLSLGVFVATFVYNLMVLRSIRAQGEADGAFVPHLSVLVALLLALGAVATLVYYLHHIPASIRINSLVAGIGRRLLRDLAKRYPEQCRSEKLPPRERGTPLHPDGSGYVEVIDFRALDQVARERGLHISLMARTGDFAGRDLRRRARS